VTDTLPPIARPGYREDEAPVVVFIDDIDRLHRDELVALLKVVRLLGRFPGETYLLAYDEATVFASIQESNLGADAQQRARLFMEKIVQYPMTVPPLLPEVMMDRLDEGITCLLDEFGAELAENDGRLGRLQDVYESQLITPRALERLLAQYRLARLLHRGGRGIEERRSGRFS
jgi:predicted KAP-like P-loop ATPase